MTRPGTYVGTFLYGDTRSEVGLSDGHVWVRVGQHALVLHLAPDAAPAVGRLVTALEAAVVLLAGESDGAGEGAGGSEGEG